MTPDEIKRLKPKEFFVATQLNNKGERPFSDIPLDEVKAMCDRLKYIRMWNRRVALDSRQVYIREVKHKRKYDNIPKFSTE